ncbi:MAG: flagellar filament capping protein FliD [Nitrosomonadales bacterium]
MAITLDGLVRNATASQQAGVTPSTKASLATGAYDLAGQDVGQQVNGTNVQLSVFGQIKSSYVDVQAAGRTLTTPAKTSTVEDVTKAVQSFADAYNNAARVVNSVGNSNNSLVGNGNINSASNNLKSIVANGGSSSDLANIGVSVNQDGTLAVDTNALQNAVQANPAAVQDTLAKVGAQAVQAAQKELVGTENVGGSTTGLNSRVKNLGSKASGQQNLANESGNAASQPITSSGNESSGGVAAYTQMIFL